MHWNKESNESRGGNTRKKGRIEGSKEGRKTERQQLHTKL